MTPAPITVDEMIELRQLHARLTYLRTIPWPRVLATPHLIGPLRNTLAAQKRARAHLPQYFELQP